MSREYNVRSLCVVMAVVQMSLVVIFLSINLKRKQQHRCPIPTHVAVLAAILTATAVYVTFTQPMSSGVARVSPEIVAETLTPMYSISEMMNCIDLSGPQF